MIISIEELANKVEAAEKTSHCLIDKSNNQIIVSFDNREDIEIALLNPYAKMQIIKGKLDDDIYSELLFSVKKIANFNNG